MRHEAAVEQVLQRGEFEKVAAAASTEFAPKLRAELSDVWASVLERCGPVTAGEDVAVTREDGIVVHDLALVGPIADAHLQLAYEGDAIVGMILRPGVPTGVFGS